MHILCPHCRNPIEVVKLTPREEIACPSCGSSFLLENTSTTAERGVGQKLGRFEVVERVGQGAFGTVYKAHDPELDRTVAVKVPRAGNLAGAQELDRFLREARSVAQLRHPSIVSIHEVGQTDGLPYLVSDFVQGVTLADLLTARRPGFREAAELVASVADALQYAHERGVVHRDVKPSNVMIGDGGKPCVMDFGLAKRDAGEITMTVEGQVLGTPAYMSPEQARGDAHKVDGRSDVYSLGVILYELLTGELPFRGNKRMLLHQVLHDEPKLPRTLNDRIPRDLETVCLKAMAKEPNRRYATARELAEELARWLSGEAIHARPVGAWERAVRWCRRNPRVAALSAAVVVALLAGTATSTFFAVQAQRWATEAESRLGQVEEKKRTAEGYLYAAHMNLAQVAADRGETGRVLEVLDLYRRPPPGQPDPRGWEWYYHDRRCGGELRQLHPPPSVGGRFHALSPDGARFALLGEDGTVTVWDVESGQALRTFRDLGRPTQAAFRADLERLAVVGGDGQIRLWDLSTGTRLTALNDPTRTDGAASTLREVAFCPDGLRLVSVKRPPRAADALTEVGVWDGATGAVLTTVMAHPKGVHSVQLSPDGRLLATHGVDGAITLWDAAGGRMLHSIPGDPRNSVRPAFSPDSRRLATGSLNAQRLFKVWDVESGRVVQTLARPSVPRPVDQFGFDPVAGSMAFSRDGAKLIALKGGAAGPQTATVWDLSQGRELRTVSGLPGWSVGAEIDPAGTTLITANLEAQVIRWNLYAGRNPRTLPHARDRGMAVSGDGRFLALGGGGRIVQVLDILTGLPRQTLRGHSAMIWTAAFNPEGDLLASGSQDRTARVWNVTTGQMRHLLQGHSGPVQGVAFSPVAPLLATVSGDNDERTKPGEVKLWDPVSGRELRTLTGHSHGLTNVAFSPDGARLATASWDETVKVWDAAGGQVLRTFPGITFGAVAVAFSPDGRRIAAGGNNDRMKVWDAATGEELLTLKGNRGWIESLAFSPDGRRLVSMSGDDGVKLWDAQTGQEVAVLRGHAAGVWGVAFTADGQRLVTADFNRTIRIWDARPLTPEVRLETQVATLLDSLTQKPLLKADLLAEILRQPGVAEAVRQKALEAVEACRDNTERLNEASWNVVKNRDGKPEDYRAAAAWMDVVCRLVPENGNYLNTRGGAQYRCGQYPEARATLTKSDQLNKGESYEDMAFLAMTHHQLGHKEPARAALARLRDFARRPGWGTNQELQALLREAEQLLNERPPKSP